MKNKKKLIAVIVSVAVVLIALIVTVVIVAVRKNRPPALEEVRARFEEVLNASGDGVTLSSLALRVVALCILTEVSAGICRDLGEAGLASKMELCGRAEILLVTLPTLARLLSVATEYLGV